MYTNYFIGFADTLLCPIVPLSLSRARVVYYSAITVNVYIDVRNLIGLFTKLCRFSRRLEEAVAEVMECFASSPGGAADVSSAMEECSEPLQSSLENAEDSVPDDIFPRELAL